MAMSRQIVAECDVSVAEQDRKKRIESGIIQYAQDSKCTDLLSQMKTQARSADFVVAWRPLCV